MTDIQLLASTHPDWIEAVLADFDAFLIDHANAEKKASGMALSMAHHYPDKSELVTAMVDLALEELTHFRDVVRWLAARGLQLSKDVKDPYVNALRREIRTGQDAYFLDRLLVAGVIEARGAERFTLVAQALPEGRLRSFYQAISRSEARHHSLFTRLAVAHFPAEAVAGRTQDLLEVEATLVRELPIRAALH